MIPRADHRHLAVEVHVGGDTKGSLDEEVELVGIQPAVVVVEIGGHGIDSFLYVYFFNLKRSGRGRHLGSLSPIMDSIL